MCVPYDSNVVVEYRSECRAIPSDATNGNAENSLCSSVRVCEKELCNKLY